MTTVQSIMRKADETRAQAYGETISKDRPYEALGWEQVLMEIASIRIATQQVKLAAMEPEQAKTGLTKARIIDAVCTAGVTTTQAVTAAIRRVQALPTTTRRACKDVKNMAARTAPSQDSNNKWRECKRPATTGAALEPVVNEVMWARQNVKPRIHDISPAALFWTCEAEEGDQ